MVRGLATLLVITAACATSQEDFQGRVHAGGIGVGQVELTTETGARLASTDADGFFSFFDGDSNTHVAMLSLYGEDLGALELESGLFADIDLGRLDGDTAKGDFLGSGMMCVAWRWIDAINDAPDGSPEVADKRKHCYASCRSASECSQTANVIVYTGKEVLDEICSHAGFIVKKLLSKVSACSGWDEADLVADRVGVDCANNEVECASCCSAEYP